jgi:hypothetical protein
VRLLIRNIYTQITPATLIKHEQQTPNSKRNIANVSPNPNAANSQANNIKTKNKTKMKLKKTLTKQQANKNSL